MTRARIPAGVAALTVLAAGCTTAHSPTTISHDGPTAGRVTGLWWLMLGLAAVVCVVVAVLFVWGMFSRRRRGEPDEEPRWSLRMILIGGLIVPLVVLTFLWVLTLQILRANSAPATSARLTIEVTGHRWWWEVRYPQQGIETANELHIPAGAPVSIVLHSADVQHSFWVPQLAPKMDLYPGRTNQIWIEAERPGTYRGQCAEFCGLEHGLMIFSVVAQPPAVFERWMAHEEAGPATPPGGSLAAAGEQVFEQQACAGCHTIRGTTAQGRVGPDLTDVGSRSTIGAGAVPNTPGYLGGWIVNAQSIKPGVLMPPVQMSGQDLQALIAYLESLR
jgi:cytochrome c oxidase subunit 2